MEEKRITSLDKLLLIKAAKDKQQEGTIKYKIKGTDEVLIINKPKAEDVLKEINSIDSKAPIMELWDNLIYLAIPELHDSDVLERFDSLDNPVGVVKKIFSPGDRVSLGQEIKSLIDEVTIEKIKN